jgi:hypothetical protein
LKLITRHVTSGGSLVKGATPTKSLIVCFKMVGYLKRKRASLIRMNVQLQVLSQLPDFVPLYSNGKRPGC